jgi:choline dehydrogenase-like flavoprotein
MPVEIVARSVVVACGAVQSSLLLQASGIRRNVGKRISFNVATPIFGEFAEPVNGAEEIPMGSYADFGNLILESVFYPPATMAASVPGWFADHTARMRRYAHLAVIGAVAPTSGFASVSLRRGARSHLPILRSGLCQSDLERLAIGARRAAEILLLAGADSVYAATVNPRPKVWTRNAGLAPELLDVDDAVLVSAHPQGGNAMSDAVDRGVVDSEFRVHDVPNVFVCDASIFPSALGVNPQLTVMALADYFSTLTW